MTFDFSAYTRLTEEDILKKLRSSLRPSRYEHTLRVADTAVALAEIWNCDIHKARLAALLHDNAKYPEDSDILKACNVYSYELSEDEKQSFSLIHSGLGALTAEIVYGVSDPDIINAVRFHTTGRPGMSILEKIIFVADFIEPGRDFPNNPSLNELRKLVVTDIDKVVMYELVNVVDFINEKGNFLGGDTLKARDYYINLFSTGSDI